MNKGLFNANQRQIRNCNGRSLALSFSVIVIVLLSFCSKAAIGQTIEDYLMIAGENNPEVNAYFHEYLAALEKIPQVGTLPDPELTVGVFLRPMERFMGNQQADIQVMQMFPWFGTLRNLKGEAAQMAWAKYELFRDAKNRLFYEVKFSWYNLRLLEEKIRIMEEYLQILQTDEQLALVRFKSNDSSEMVDVLKVRIEINSLKNRLAELINSRLPLQNEFNQLLNRDSGEIILIPNFTAESDFHFRREDWPDSISLNNPMLKMLDAESETFEIQQQMAKLEGRPMLGAGVTYMPFSPRTEAGKSMGGNDMIMPMIRLSIPIYRKRVHALNKEAELNQAAVQLRRENTVNQLATQWSAALQNLEDATRRTQLYQEQTELATQSLNILMKAYSTGGTGLEDLWDIRLQLLDYELESYSAITDRLITVAKLEMLAALDIED